MIDDDPVVRRTVTRILRSSGHETVEAAYGQKGIETIGLQRVDLVITDLYMPGQDGIETIQQLRDEFPRSRIIAMSGGASVAAEGPLRDAEMFGADATLAKPFSMQHLNDVVAGILRDG